MGNDNIRFLQRTVCVFDQSTDLEILYKIPKFPIHMTCTTDDIKYDIFHDMELQICKHTGFVQLSSVVPLDRLYGKQHSGTIGRLWKEHHTKFAEFIHKFNPLSILEIGGGHGKLANAYITHNIIPWTIIDPIPNNTPQQHLTYINRFFDQSYNCEHLIFDTIVHSHVFEHIYEPDKFLEHINYVMNEGNKLIFSVPNLAEQLKRNYTNVLNFEHTIFLTEPYIEFLLIKYGFKILKKTYFKQDHSIWYACVKTLNISNEAGQYNLFETNRKLFFNHIEYIKNLINKLNIVLNEASNPVFIFGAHVFTQFLIANGLSEQHIQCILDNDIEKQGKRLYGTNLMVSPPTVLSKEKEPIVIIHAGSYSNEICVQVKKINNKTLIL
jgi:2-polyprenyl-3-methyl-5-hydroxy-6-metoxy-1,4-benzoquinol methylase